MYIDIYGAFTYYGIFSHTFFDDQRSPLWGAMPLDPNNNNNTLGQRRRHQVSNSERLLLLHRAIHAHRAYTERVLNGESFDRHLLALRLIATENRMPMGDLYADEAFKRFNHFHISSSQITSRLGYDSVSFYGPAVEDSG